MWVYSLLIVPAVLGALALRTDDLPFKLGVPIACSAILVIRYGRTLGSDRKVGWVLAAFAFSALGDYFLSTKGGRASLFVAGIGAYLVAHLGYLAFSLAKGNPNWLALAFLLAGYLTYYAWRLRPAIASSALSLAVLLYLLVSCASLAAALGMRLAGLPKAWYVVGIALILLSDTFISFNEFLAYRQFNWLVLPTYYVAQISITASVLSAGSAGS